MHGLRNSVPEGAIGLEPGSTPILPGDVLDGQLKKVDLMPLEDCFQSIIDSTQLPVRRDVEAPLGEIPELSNSVTSDSDSDSDSSGRYGEQALSRSRLQESFVSNSRSHTLLDTGTIIGGAKVRNLCLVVANGKSPGFVDLPINTLTASDSVKPQLVAAILKSADAKPELPILILPVETQSRADLQDRAFYEARRPATFQNAISNMKRFNFTTLSSLDINEPEFSASDGVSIETKDAEKKEDTNLGATELGHFVISGDIEEFFGIKGLTGKLYKFKGPAKKEETSEGKPEGKRGMGQAKRGGSGGYGGKSQVKVRANNSKKTPKGADESDDAEEEEPAREKVKLNPKSLAFDGMPLGTIFPFLENEEIRNLPIEKLEFTYSEETEKFIFAPGLRLELDVCLRGSMQWAGDALKKLFGSHTPPTTVHLSAHLSNERDWSKSPKIEKLVLQGSFRDMELKPWDFLNFNSMGLEIVAEKAAKSTSGKDRKESEETKDPPADVTADNGEQEEDGKQEGDGKQEEDGDKEKTKKSWYYSFGFFGTVQITNIAHANTPLEMTYRIARDFVAKTDDDESAEHERVWSLVVVSDEWKDIYNIKNLTMSDAKLEMSFKESAFKETVKLELSGKLKLGDGTLEAKGFFSRDTNSVSAEVGNLKFSDIKKIHAQMIGQKLPEGEEDEKEKQKDKEKEENQGDEETAGNELTFKKVVLKLSREKTEEKTTRNALELEGEVTFNEHASATAALTFASEGLTVTGGISDFEIPETDITVKKAGLLIFIAFRQGKTSDKKDNPEKLTEDSEKHVAKRESKFGVLGIVKVHETTFKVGFYIERTIDSEQREWLAFGGVSRINLSQMWDLIPRESFLNLQLSNVAVIASSKDRKKKKKDLEDDKSENEGCKDQYPRLKPRKNKKGRVGGQGDEKDRKANLGGGEVWERITKVPKSKRMSDVEIRKKRKALGQYSLKPKGEDEADEEDKEESSNWDVWEEVDAYNYPIVKGFQICATISTFPQLEQLNGNKKIGGLTLILSINSQGKFKASIDLPESWQVPLSSSAYLCNFGSAIGFGVEGPELHLSASLTWLCKGYDPVIVHGKIVGTFVGMHGELRMSDDSEWVNPFDLNENLVVSKLGIETGFDYATVLVRGPNSLALQGRVKIGKFDLSMLVAVRTLTADVVFEFKYPNMLDVMDIVGMAGTLTDDQTLTDMSTSESARGMVIFEDLLVYLSTGAEFLGKYYDRGIQVKGKLELFGKKGEFDGSFNDNGVIIKAGMDNFKIGGLEVTSARPGEKRALLDVEMTTEKQRIFVDGMIRFYDFEFKMFIDADVQKKKLEAEVSISFTESLFISLMAEIDGNQGPLDQMQVTFEGELRLDIREVIFEGINEGIRLIEALAVESINDVEKSLNSQIATKKVELEEMRLALEELQRQTSDEVASKKQKVREQNKKMEQLQADLDKFQKEYKKARDAKVQNQNEINAQEAQRDEAQRKLQEKKREAKEDYQQKLDENRAKRDHWETERKRLENEKEAKWGDDLRLGEGKDAAWDWWSGEIDKTYKWKCDCEWNFGDCYFWDKPYWFEKMVEAAATLEWQKRARDVDMARRDVAREILNWPVFQGIQNAIEDAGREIDKFGRAVDSLVSGHGMWGYIEEMSKDQDAEVNRTIEILRGLIAKSEELEKNLKVALAELEKQQVGISKEQKAAEQRIIELEGQMKTLPSEIEYRDKKKLYDQVEAQMQQLVSALEDVKNGICEALRGAQRIVNKLKQGVPTIKQIHVRISNEALSNSSPLRFDVEAEWLGQSFTCSIEWAPNQDPFELYRRAANKLVSGNEEITNDPEVSAYYLSPQKVRGSARKARLDKAAYSTHGRFQHWGVSTHERLGGSSVPRTLPGAELPRSVRRSLSSTRDPAPQKPRSGTKRQKLQ